MALNFLLKRSGTASKRPTAASMSLGELDLNYDSNTGGLYYKDSAGNVIKVGPCQVSATAPNVAPAGSSGNSKGEFWYDTANSTLKLYNGTTWVNVNDNSAYLALAGGTMTGDITFAGSQTFPVSGIDSASTTQPGVVQLEDSVTSTSTSLALTANQGYNLQQQIDALSVASNIILAGTIDASTGDLVTVTTEGTAAGFTVGDPLPSAASGNDSYFVIVTVGGTMTPPGGSAQLCHQGDWWLSDGAAWVFLDVGFNATAATTSSPGIVQLATDAEVQAGVNTDHAVTPSGLQSKVSDSTSTTSSTTLASSTAVKAAYDAGVQGQTDAAAAQGDATQALSDAAAAQADATQALSDAAAAQATADAAVPDASYTAVGDILSGTGAGTYSALALGTDGDVLTADSACASGVKWAAGGGGGGSPATPTTEGTLFGRSDCVLCNSAVGYNSLLSLVDGTNNVVIGDNAACSLTDGFRNIAVGSFALSSNNGIENVAVGHCALANSTSSFQVAIGCGALCANVEGVQNTAVGYQAMRLGATGSNSTAVGSRALRFASGDNNVGIGTDVLRCVSGNANIAMGVSAGRNLTSGSSNTILGNNSGGLIGTGNYNVIIGSGASPSTDTSCELYIGTDATANFNWLTGDSTQAIKPGAGIIDCAGSCGSAGQVLMSTGLNSICWGTAGGGSGTVTSVTAGAGLTGGTITTSGTIAIDAACVLEPTDFTAKGQILVATGSGTYSALGVGTNAQVLTADSACTAGVKWAAAGGGASNATPSAAGIVLGCTTDATFCNTALGFNALCGVTPGLSTGRENVALGTCAAKGLTGGVGNVIIGIDAGCAIANAADSVHIGRCAGQFAIGNLNVSMGTEAMLGSASTTISAQCNVSIGLRAMGVVTTGSNNAVLGANAGCNITTGIGNVAIGHRAMANTAVTAHTGLFNVAVGQCTLVAMTSGCYNTAVGNCAGLQLTTGCGNTIIGVKNAAGGYAPAFNITTQSNRISMGSTSTTNADIQVAWTVVSDARDKIVDGSVPHGLDFVNQLEPKTFYFTETRGDNTPHGPKRYGFLAQDILALEGLDPVIINAEDPDKYRYNGEALVPVLVNAIKELSAQNAALEARIAALENP